MEKPRALNDAKALFGALFVFILSVMSVLQSIKGGDLLVIIAFQIILLIVILIGFLGVVGEEKNKDLSNNMALICVTGIAAFIVSILWF